MHSSTSNRQVTEFPNYKGDLCLQAEPSSCSWLRILLLQVQWHSRAADAQGIFNGESILLPSDMEFDAEAADCDDSVEERFSRLAGYLNARYHAISKSGSVDLVCVRTVGVAKGARVPPP